MAIRINDNSSIFSGKMGVTISSFSPDFDGEFTSDSPASYDGALVRSLDSFDVSLQDSTWPSFWPQAAATYTISGLTTVLGQEWTAHRDLVHLQGRPWPTNGNTQTLCADGIEALQNQFGTHTKYCMYVMNNWAKNDPNSHRYLQYQLIEAQDNPLLWKGATAGGDVLFGTKDQEDAYMTNMSDVCPEQGSGVAGQQKYYEAYHDRLFDRWTLGSDMTDGRISGVYWDGLDPTNAFPQPRVGSSTGADYDSSPDYDHDGSIADNSQDDYRRGHLDAVDYVYTASQSIFTDSSTCFVSTNGGRDRAYYDAGTSDLQNETWYKAFDHRLVENVDTGLVIVENGDFTFQYNDVYERVIDNIRAGHVCYELCKPQASNRLGRPYGGMHIEMGGFNGCTINDYTQAERDWASFWYALCMSTEELLWMGQTSRQWSSPPPDEWFYDIGSPLSTRTLGTLSNDASFTMRAPDDDTDGAWYFTEFQNGYFYINFPDLRSLGTSPGGLAYGTDFSLPTYSTTAYPATPAGKVARKMDSSSYTSPRSGLTAYGYNTTRNDGGLAYDGGSLVEPAWRGGLVIWADS